MKSVTKNNLCEQQAKHISERRQGAFRTKLHLIQGLALDLHGDCHQCIQ